MLTRISIPSPNYSSRAGTKVRLIVLHTAEGAKNIQSLGSFFANPASNVSSHVGIDDTPNTVGEYVERNYKAWTAANANPSAVQAEFCAWANWNSLEWQQHPIMLQNGAKWIAEEAAKFGIPVVKLTPQQAQSTGSGVCQHVDLGSWGGNHHDCGPSFPMDQVIAMANGVEPVTKGGAVEICNTPSGKGYWICGSDGGIFTYGDAQFYGSLGNTALNAPIVSMSCTPSGKGYWLLGEDGGVFTFGDAAFYGAATGLVK